jgi:hypothetical protein
VQLESIEGAYVDPWSVTISEKYIGIKPRRREPYKLFDRSGKFISEVGSFGGGPVENQAKIIQFDVKTGELIKELAPPAHLFVQKFGGDEAVLSTRNKQGFFDFHSISDTLYHFDLKNDRIVPFFTMPFSTSQKITKRYMILNKDFLLTHILCWEESGLCERMGLVAIDLKHKTSSFVNFENDFFGNLTAPIDFYHLQNGYWTQSIMPGELMENIENRLAERNLSDSDREILEKTLTKLTEGENNVVFFGKLKDEVKAKLW